MKETENGVNQVLDGKIIMCAKVSVVDLENKKKKKKKENVEESD